MAVLRSTWGRGVYGRVGWFFIKRSYLYRVAGSKFSIMDIGEMR